MQVDEIRSQLLKLDTHQINMDLNGYTTLLKECVQRKEMRASVFIYDDMKRCGYTPDEDVYQLLNALHSRDLPENDTLMISPPQKGVLQPRRRIHKIMKGHLYSENYEAACEEYLKPIIEFLKNNPEKKSLNKDRLIPLITKELGIDKRSVRYVMTKLKRTNFLYVK